MMDRIYQRCLITTGLILLLAVTLQAADLEALRSIYTTQLQSIESDAAAELNAWPERYLKDLTALQKTMQRAGDLAGWKAVADEITRFRKSRRLPDSPPVSVPAKLRELQENFRETVPELNLDKSERILQLSDMYIAHLTELQTDLTKRGEIEQAMAVFNEIKAVKKSPAYAAAEFAIADRDAGLAREDATPGDAQADQEEDSAPGPADDAGLVSEGTVIYEPSTRPPRVQSLSRSPLYATEHSPLKRDVSVVIETAGSTDVSRDRDRSYGSTYRSSHGSSTHLVRLALRTARTSLDLKNVNVTVQYFTKSAEKRAGKLAPTEAAIKFITLPSLDSNVVYVDCPPVKLSQSSYSYHSHYDGYTWSQDRGQEFYGIIISVFTEDGELAYQGATTKHLGSAAASPRQRPATELLRQQYETARDTYYRTRDAYYSSGQDPTLESAYRAAEADYRTAQREYYSSRDSSRE